MRLRLGFWYFLTRDDSGVHPGIYYNVMTPLQCSIIKKLVIISYHLYLSVSTWSDRELRTLLAQTGDTPVQYHRLQELHAALINCSQQHPVKPVPTPPYERYADSHLVSTPPGSSHWESNNGSHVTVEIRSYTRSLLRLTVKLSYTR